MRPTTRALAVPDTRIAWAAAAMAGASALYLQGMSPGLLAALRFGAVCTHGGLLTPHCPACYLAAAIAAAATGVAASILRPSKGR